MNKRDCDAIGYILADSRAPEHILERFFALDERIKIDYEGYLAMLDRDQAVSDRFEALMIEQLGERWSIMKRAREITPEVYDQARREILGDDYTPLKKKGRETA